MAPHTKTLHIERELAENAMLLRRHLLALGDVEGDLTFDLTAVGEIGAASLGVVAGYARSHARRGWQCTYLVGDPLLFRLLALSEAPVVMCDQDANA